MRYWIFQANPTKFPLKEVLLEDDPDIDWWQTNQHARRIQLGDQVLLWQSGKEAGVYAHAVVTGWPKLTSGARKLAVTLDLQTNFVDKPLLKKLLVRTRGLEKLGVLRKIPAGTNFPVSESEWRILNRLLARPLKGDGRPRRPQERLPEDPYDYDRVASSGTIRRMHNRLSNEFAKWLRNRRYSGVVQEKNRIDVDFNDGAETCRAELKVCPLSTRHGIRQALGQLLEYNYYGGHRLAKKWFVVLDREASPSDVQFVGRLRSKLQLPVYLGWRESNGNFFMGDVQTRATNRNRPRRIV